MIFISIADELKERQKAINMYYNSRFFTDSFAVKQLYLERDSFTKASSDDR